MESDTKRTKRTKAEATFPNVSRQNSGPYGKHHISKDYFNKRTVTGQKKENRVQHLGWPNVTLMPPEVLVAPPGYCIPRKAAFTSSLFVYVPKVNRSLA